AIEMLHCRVARRRREQYAASPETREWAAREDGQEQVREELLAAVQRLPTRLREPVRLCYLEGRGQREVARLVGCHQGNLSRRLMEGLGRLRSTLLRRGVVAGAVGLALWFKTKIGMATAAMLLIGAMSVPFILPTTEPDQNIGQFIP